MHRTAGAGVPGGGGVGSGLLGSGVGGVLGALSSWVADGAAWLLGQIGGVLSSSTSIDLGAGWFTAHYRTMVGLAAVVLLPLLLLSVIQAVYRQSAAALVRVVAVQLPLALVLAGRRWSWCSWPSRPPTPSAPRSRPVRAPTSSRRCRRWRRRWRPRRPAARRRRSWCCWGALLVAFGAFMLWVELLVREAAVYVAVLFLPLGLASLVWPAISHWCRRLVDTLVALVLAKFVIVAILALAAGALAAGTGTGFASVLGGAPAPPGRLHPVHVPAAGARGGGRGGPSARRRPQRGQQAAGSAPRSAANLALRHARESSFVAGEPGTGLGSDVRSAWCRRRRPAGAGRGSPAPRRRRRRGTGPRGRPADGPRRGRRASGIQCGGGRPRPSDAPGPTRPRAPGRSRCLDPCQRAGARSRCGVGRSPSSTANGASAAGSGPRAPLLPPRRHGPGPACEHPDDGGVAGGPGGRRRGGGSVAPEGTRYRFGPLERRGLVAGWRGGQIASVAGGLVVAVLVLRSQPTPVSVVVALVTVVGGIALACWPVGGRTGEEWLPTVARWEAAGRPGRAATARRPRVQGHLPRGRRRGPRGTAGGRSRGDRTSDRAASARSATSSSWSAGGPARRAVRGRGRPAVADLHRRARPARPQLRPARPGRQGAAGGRLGRRARLAGPAGLGGAPGAVVGHDRARRRAGRSATTWPSGPNSARTATARRSVLAAAGRDGGEHLPARGALWPSRSRPAGQRRPCRAGRPGAATPAAAPPCCGRPTRSGASWARRTSVVEGVLWHPAAGRACCAGAARPGPRARAPHGGGALPEGTSRRTARQRLPGCSGPAGRGPWPPRRSGGACGPTALGTPPTGSPSGRGSTSAPTSWRRSCSGRRAARSRW